MNRLAEIIFKKPVADCSAEETEQLTQKYPFFNAGHLLAVNKNHSGSENYLTTYFQKASLYFHPLFLDAAINKTGEAVITPKVPEQALETATLTSEQSGKEENPETITETSPAAKDISVQVPGIIEKPVAIAEQQVQATPDSQQPEPGFSFEPYHTVDYFASQGIKVKLDEVPADKFSKQLKSFTEWLKTMKKIPAAAETAPPATGTVEQKVEQLAATSLTDSNVITEAMAEVWVRQGKPEKAIEIYHKLSLLEPAKSPFFATRISELKKY